MQIVLTINTAAVYGVTAARAAFNAENSSAPLASDEAYVQHVLARAVENWCAQYAAVAPPPDIPPVVVEGVPQSVTRRQGRQALILAGKLHLVQQAIDAIPDATQRAMMQSEWDDSQEFHRQRPSLILLATAIGLDAAATDALFIQAGGL